MSEILISDRNHPGAKYFSGFPVVFDMNDLEGGGDLFLVSCTQKITKETRDRYNRVLVLHESSLPQGRGWSPWAWTILNGGNTVTVSLIFAEEEIDAGDVLNKEVVIFGGHELSSEIHRKLAIAKKNLILWAMENKRAKGTPQVGEPTYLKRRTPEDSRLDPEKSIASQFDLLRICDKRFPAFFILRGHKYAVTLEEI